MTLSTSKILPDFPLESHDENDLQQENDEWSHFSLEQAMEGLEGDNLPEYTEQDLYAPHCD